MSKEAALRAMREARYNERAGSSSTAPRAARAVSRPAKAAAGEPVAPAAATEELCGHRSMNGRSCTREQGHAAKSHRYS